VSVYLFKNYKSTFNKRLLHIHSNIGPQNAVLPISHIILSHIMLSVFLQSLLFKGKLVAISWSNTWLVIYL